jgi:hypothetical protein
MGNQALKQVGMQARLPSIATYPHGAVIRHQGIALEAKHENLLYVSDSNASAVYVYSYPKAKLVGTLQVLTPGGMCGDSKGNVWITSFASNAVFEYAHGGSKAIAAVGLDDQAVFGCAIDPSTGSLAVASFCEDVNNVCEKPGSLFVFSNTKKAPQQYAVLSASVVYYCGYDATGNLFVDGYENPSGPAIFAELPKGGNGVQSIPLDRPLYSPGAIQWDGKHLAVGDVQAGNEITSSVHEVDVNEGKGTIVGTTNLHGTTQIGQFWIQGSTIVTPNTGFESADPSDVRLYSYPKGGIPQRIINSSNFQNPAGAVVSLAAK